MSRFHASAAPAASRARILAGAVGFGGVVFAALAGVVACSAPSREATASLAPAMHEDDGSASGGSRARSAVVAKDSYADSYHGRCPRDMVEIPAIGRTKGYCVDRYEASLREVLPSGEERPFSPYESVEDANVRAVSEQGVFPQGYISAFQAQRACSASGKRLCRLAEWQKACRGPEKNQWSYGAARQVGRCNDNGKNPVIALYGFHHWNWQTMNQPDLNQLEGTLAKTGSHEGCTNGYGVYDMVGNLHEWIADPQGSFYGGYFSDVSSVGHGEGCGYVTTAHEARYHDYSTGFRCCADLAGAKK